MSKSLVIQQLVNSILRTRALNGVVPLALLLEDGVIGPMTIGAIESLPDSLRSVIRNFATDLGLSFKSYVRHTELEPFIKTASNSFGIPVSYFDMLLDLENKVIVSQGAKRYEVDNTGSFQGLGQFSLPTWRRVKKRFPEFPLGDRTDSEDSIMAIGWLARSHKALLRGVSSTTYPSNEMLYLFHNQGWPDGLAYLRGQPPVGSQSKDALKVLQQARNQFHAKY